MCIWEDVCACSGCFVLFAVFYLETVCAVNVVLPQSIIQYIKALVGVNEVCFSPPTPSPHSLPFVILRMLYSVVFALERMLSKCYVFVISDSKEFVFWSIVWWVVLF